MNPKCPTCGKEMKRAVSHSERNPDRPYYTCWNRAHFKDSFAWADKFQGAARVEPSFSSKASEKKTNLWGEDGSTGAVTLPQSDGAATQEESAAESIVCAPGQAGLANPDNDVDAAPSRLSFLSPTKIDMPVAEKPKRAWSKYQKDVFDFVKSGDNNAVVEAVAGGGKTSTLVEALDYTPNSAKVAFLAFNKHIAEELDNRAPEHVHVSTLHSLGLSNAKHSLGNNLKVDTNKLWKVFDSITLFEDNTEIAPATIHVVKLLKANLMQPTLDNVLYLADRYNIEMNGDAEKISAFAEKVYLRSIADKTTLDFDDMIFWCARGDIRCEQFDFVMSDESQDYNPAQRQMILNSVGANGRVIAVGDRSQSIMGFQGADVESIPNFINILNAQTLPLSITYRCPKAVVRLAQELVPQIEWREDAPEGIVAGIAAPNIAAMVKPGDMVLCRLNAPLVKPCMELIRNRIKATIRGREIGNGLISMLIRGQKRAQSQSLAVVMEYLWKYVSTEIAKLNAARKFSRALALEDQFDTLLALGDGCTMVAEIKRVIGSVFSDANAAVVFSSVHRAKGLEADRVFILHPELMPFSKAVQEWEQIQERNLMYVAWTRAKKELYFVQS